MSTQNELIDRIVREVVARLRAGGAAAQGACSAWKPSEEKHCGCGGKEHHGATSGEACCAGCASGRGCESGCGGKGPETKHEASRELVLQRGLVTAAMLEGRLSGIVRVTVPVGAVVTPAALDELRQRRIELRRSGTREGAVLVAEFAARFDSGAFRAALKRAGIAVEMSGGGAMAEAWSRLVRAASEGRRAVLLSDEPGQVLCESGAMVDEARRCGVTTAIVRGRACAREAAQQGARLAVVHSAGLVAYQAARIVQEFVAPASETAGGKRGAGR